MQIFFYTKNLLYYLFLKEIYEHYNEKCIQLSRLQDLQFFINKIIVRNSNCVDFIAFSFYKSQWIEQLKGKVRILLIYIY